MGNWVANMTTVMRGIPAFFEPNLDGAGPRAPSWASRRRPTTAPSRCGARSANSSTSAGSPAADAPDRRRRQRLQRRDALLRQPRRALCVEHVMASARCRRRSRGAHRRRAVLGRRHLPNTPIEAVLDDRPRRDSLIFAVNVWHQTAPEPESIWQVMGRQKDIQFASRADSHIARQKQIHRLRHVIRELTRQLPTSRQADRRCASWPPGAAARRCTSRTCSRRAWTARTT